MYRFPLDPQVCIAAYFEEISNLLMLKSVFYIICYTFQLLERWIEVIGRQDLLKRGYEIIRKNYRACGKHFSSKHLFIANRNRTNLKRDAIPDLYVCGK